MKNLFLFFPSFLPPCHAAIRAQGGVLKGGHMITTQCIVGPNPISVLVTSLDDFELKVCFDPETNIALLQPQQLVKESWW